MNGRPVFAFAQDFTSRAGSLGEMHSKKICKVMDLALKAGVPFVGFNDSGGARIQEGVDSLSAYGQIFYRNAIASGVIPQISAIMGPTAGGAVYSPAMTDFIFMVKNTSYMFITGPDVIKSVTGEEISFEDLGGAMAHNVKSGVAHFACESDSDAIDQIKRLLSFLPNNNMEDPPLMPTADPAVYLLDPLTREPPAGAERCTATASETAERAAESAVDASTGPWPAWTGPLEGWAEDPGRKTAWDLYAQAAEALTQYQNSGRASLSVLDKAVAALYAAQDSRFYRSPPSELDKRELSTRLKKVYRLLGLSAPGGLAQKSEPGDVPEPDSEPAAIVSGRDGNRLWFELPQDNAPEGLLKSLLVSWDKDAVAFELTLRSSVPAGASLDVYMDINHRSGAGSIDLLPGRASFLNAADAWEYALTLSEDRAVLYRFIPGQGNVVLDKPRVSGDPREGDVRVSVPRARLRGNPAAWGYAALLMRGPDAPFDVLAVASPQRKTAPGDARYRRYSALRLKGQGVRP